MYPFQQVSRQSLWHCNMSLHARVKTSGPRVLTEAGSGVTPAYETPLSLHTSHRDSKGTQAATCKTCSPCTKMPSLSSHTCKRGKTPSACLSHRVAKTSRCLFLAPFDSFNSSNRQLDVTNSIQTCRANNSSCPKGQQTPLSDIRFVQLMFDSPCD